MPAPLNRKVAYGSGVGPPAGGAITIIALWIFTDQQFGFNYSFPDEVVIAISTVVTMLTTFVAGWITKSGGQVQEEKVDEAKEVLKQHFASPEAPKE